MDLEKLEKCLAGFETRNLSSMIIFRIDSSSEITDNLSSFIFYQKKLLGKRSKKNKPKACTTSHTSRLIKTLNYSILKH